MKYKVVTSPLSDDESEEIKDFLYSSCYQTIRSHPCHSLFQMRITLERSISQFVDRLQIPLSASDDLDLLALMINGH